MNGESTYVVIAEFNLACVESGADFDAELASAYGDGLAATYGAGRAVERGEDAVPGCLYEAAPLMFDLLAAEGVVLIEQTPPAPLRLESVMVISNPVLATAGSTHVHPPPRVVMSHWTSNGAPDPPGSIA